MNQGSEELASRYNRSEGQNPIRKVWASQQLDEITRDDDSGTPCFRAWRRLHVALACCHVPRDLAQAHNLLGVERLS